MSDHPDRAAAPRSGEVSRGATPDGGTPDRGWPDGGTFRTRIGDTGASNTGTIHQGAHAGDPGAFEAALAAAGIPARVRADGRLAVLSGPAETFASSAARDAAARLARAHGFTHAALVLAEDATDGPS